MDGIIVARVNGALVDLTVPLTEDATVELLDFESPEGKQVFWHSAAHLLGHILEAQFGDSVKLCDGPPLDEGAVTLVATTHVQSFALPG